MNLGQGAATIRSSSRPARHRTKFRRSLVPVSDTASGVNAEILVRVAEFTERVELQSDVPIPEEAFTALSQRVLEESVEDFDRAIFLAGAPAQSEEQQGDVIGVATTEEQKTELEEADVDLMKESGAVGGMTGSLVNACHQADVPAVLLLVQADPRLPDPAAARSVIETALEPLVEFDIDELQEQAEEIQRQKQQVAQQLQQVQEQEEEPMQARSMFR
ncbi:PAC2 family protein [Haloterrigena turkmenica]|uniref:PAC2 family protein n=1 Tax=Haloterrigena turkmenica TaxID=62320 RepID=UPI000677DB06